ncbi:MAG: hypothetical protein IJ871_09310 [Ruminococcus sp.]|nr:hypothetical protein [Ruminococcus sp.]MBR2305310.1 hypothetical protein [Ruminococcus sp.]
MTEKEFNQLLESLELDEEQLELISGGLAFREDMTPDEFLKLLNISQDKQKEPIKYGNGIHVWH